MNRRHWLKLLIAAPFVAVAAKLGIKGQTPSLKPEPFVCWDSSSAYWLEFDRPLYYWTFANETGVYLTDYSYSPFPADFWDPEVPADAKKGMWYVATGLFPTIQNLELANAQLAWVA